MGGAVERSQRTIAASYHRLITPVLNGAQGTGHRIRYDTTWTAFSKGASNSGPGLIAYPCAISTPRRLDLVSAGLAPYPHTPDSNEWLNKRKNG